MNKKVSKKINEKIKKAYGNLADAYIELAQHAAELEEAGVTIEHANKIKNAAEELSVSAHLLLLSVRNLDQGEVRNAASEVGYCLDSLKRASRQFNSLWDCNFDLDPKDRS